MSDGIDSENHAAMGSRDRHPVGQAGVYGFLCAFALLVAVAGCSDSDSGDGSTKINGSIHVPVGKQPGAVATVNGSIHIDDNAAITSATTVNGSVHLGAHAAASSLKSVNGEISLGAGAHASGSIASVNGEFTLEDGADAA